MAKAAKKAAKKTVKKAAKKSARKPSAAFMKPVTPSALRPRSDTFGQFFSVLSRELRVSQIFSARSGVDFSMVRKALIGL